MCIVEREIYIQPTGARQVIETERPCRNATATRLCNNVDHRQIQRSYTGINAPSLARENQDDLIITEGRGGTERVYREVTGRLRRRRSKTNRHSASSSGTPISSADSLSVSSPSRYSTVEVRPAGSSPRIPSWDHPLREQTTDRRSIERHGSTTQTEKPSHVFPPSVKSSRPATNEGNHSPSGPEQSQPISIPNRIPPDRYPPHIDIQPRRFSLQPQTELRIPSPTTTPIISSPGLSNLPELRHRRNDSGKGFIAKDSSRGRSGSQSDRSSLRRSAAEGQRVRFEDNVAVRKDERDGESRSWSTSSGERGDRGGEGSGGAFDRRWERVRGEDGRAERQEKAPAAAPGHRGYPADERENSTERRDRHRRRAEDALNGRVRNIREGSTDSEPRELARDRPAARIIRPEDRPVQEDYEASRSSKQTIGRSPLTPSSTSRSSASPPATSRQIRRVTIHQYRYGENV